MAPPRVEDSLSQLMAKIDEGNKETYMWIDSMQSAMEKMENTVKGLVTDRSDFKRWRPEIKANVVEMTEVLKTLQGQVNAKPGGGSPILVDSMKPKPTGGMVTTSTGEPSVLASASASIHLNPR
jgi:hypothetical protein